jgi:ATP-dependent protease Clp ATPase subunit
MLDIMYKIPSMDGVRSCYITESVITRNAEPKFSNRRKQQASRA